MPFNIDISSIEAIFDAEKKLYSNYFTIKVKTCYYHSNKGIHSRKDITILKRKSDQNMASYFFEDISMVGVEHHNHFGQFFDLEDGEYQVFLKCHRSSYYDDDYDCEYIIKKV